MGHITWQRIRGIAAPIPVLPQRQDSLDEQITDLYAVANALGMYDAADWLKQLKTLRTRYHAKYHND